MSEHSRVVITGLGAVTPLGIGIETLWSSLESSRSGIAPIQAFPTADFKSIQGAEVNNDSLTAAVQAEGFTRSDRTVDMALVAAAQALRQAGILSADASLKPMPVATILGTGVGASHSLFNCFMTYHEKGPRGLRPTSVPRCMANAISSQVSMRFRLTGPNYVIVSACASATTAIGQAARMIRHGYATQVLTGGADAPFDPLVYGGWNNLGVMSKAIDPAKACRPFDAARDGCVLGEGAGALLLESLDSALARGATILGELMGFGEASDAEHITSPSVEGQAASIRAAINDARISPADIGFINAHGTGTRANDETESASIRLALGEDATIIPTASNKSFFGHLLGAAGAVESIVTILGLRAGRMPGNLTLETPDPKCNLCLPGPGMLDIPSPIAMKNSFGFGGNNAVLVFKRWEP